MMGEFGISLKRVAWRSPGKTGWLDFKSQHSRTVPGSIPHRLRRCYTFPRNTSIKKPPKKRVGPGGKKT